MHNSLPLLNPNYSIGNVHPHRNFDAHVGHVGNEETQMHHEQIMSNERTRAKLNVASDTIPLRNPLHSGTGSAHTQLPPSRHSDLSSAIVNPTHQGLIPCKTKCSSPRLPITPCELPFEYSIHIFARKRNPTAHPSLIRDPGLASDRLRTCDHVLNFGQ